MKYDRHRDRLVDLLLRETLGDETTPDLTDRILQKAFPSRIVPLWMPVAVAAIALLLLGGWLFLPQPYPSPRIDNTLVQRGQMIEAETKARELTLGGVCACCNAPRLEHHRAGNGQGRTDRIAIRQSRLPRRPRAWLICRRNRNRNGPGYRNGIFSRASAQDRRRRHHEQYEGGTGADDGGDGHGRRGAGGL